MFDLFQGISFEKSTVKLVTNGTYHCLPGFGHRFFEFRGRGRGWVSTRTCTFTYCSSNQLYGWRFTFLFHLCKLFFGLRFRKSRAYSNVSFGCKYHVRRKEEATSRRGPANCHRGGQLLMALHLLDHPENGKSFSLLLCHCARLNYL